MADDRQTAIVEAIETWVARCQAAIDERDTRGGTITPVMRHRLVIEPGRRFARIVCEAGTVSRSAWAFVDLNSGDIYKPASWRAPAKHARGSICDQAGGMSMVSAYGVAYLR